MAYILQIDTSTENAIVSLSQDDKVIRHVVNPDQKNHSSFLQPAIKEIVDLSQISFAQIDAVGVVIGPGSYTGLRVGLAAAKGLCFALRKPLLTINTLELMAFTAALSAKNAIFLCPMIDARRMEVFTAVYNHDMKVIAAPCAIVINPSTFSEIFTAGEVILNGNGAKKFIAQSNSKNLIYAEPAISPEAMAILFYKQFTEQRFADVAYSEPFYIKPFYTTKL